MTGPSSPDLVWSWFLQSGPGCSNPVKIPEAWISLFDPGYLSTAKSPQVRSEFYYFGQSSQSSVQVPPVRSRFWFE